MTLEIRSQRADDRHQVRDVITAAFGDNGSVADLAEALRARTDRQAGLVAVVDAAVVGHTQLSVSWVDAPSRLIEVLVLSPLAVAPTHQANGIGARLLAAATTAAGELGAPLLFLEGDPAYYARHGCRPAGPFGFTAPSARIPAAAFQLVTLPSYDPAVMSGALVYNDTFWSHDCVGLRS